MSRLAIRTFLLQGGTLIALASLVERSFLFIANASSARIAGVENFGTYGLALQAAGFLASQASLGIGMVATRFSSEYPVGHVHNRDFVQKIVQLSLILSLISAVLMMGLAWPMAHWFYNKPLFFRVLLVTVFTAPVFVLLDAARGLMLGLSYYRGLVLLSSIFGVTMLCLMPLAAMRSPRMMVFTHGVCALAACIVIFLVLQRRFHLNLFSPASREVPVKNMLRFGLLQLGSSAAVNMVMMVLMALLVRYASREELMATALLPMGMVLQQGTVWMMNIGLSYYPMFGFREVGYYSAASSMRNVIAMIPGLLNQTTIGLMTNLRGEQFGGVNRIVVINTWLSAIFMMPVTALALILLPWLLPLVYGKGFIGGVAPASYLLVVGLIHMISQPAVNRLTVVRPRTVIYIQAAWIVVALVAAFLLVPRMGATGVAIALLLAHTASALLVPLGLQWHQSLPRHLLQLTVMGILGGITLLSVLDYQHQSIWHWSNGLVLIVASAVLYCLWRPYEQIRKDQ